MSSNKKNEESSSVRFRNVASLQKRGFFGLIFGRPGVGKTSLLAYRDKNFFIGNEINREFSKLNGFESINNWKDFLNQFKYIKESETFKNKYDTIVVDNFSDIEGMMIEDFTRGENLNSWNKGYGAGHVECEKRSRDFIKDYLKPLQEEGTNIIFICHCDEKYTEDLITGNSQTEYIPALGKRTLKPFEAHASFIFHLHIPIVAGDKTFKRVLLTSPTVASKSTKKKNYIDLPDKVEIKNPKETWNHLYDKLIFKGSQ